MAETVGQHSVAAFTSPVNGTTPIDANTVRGNDNTVRSAYVDHDADPGIHVQSSTLASRPVAGTAGRKWVTVSSGRYQFWYDDGSRWHEVASDAVNVDCLADTALTKGDVIKITGFNNGQNLPTVAKVSASTDTAFGLVENTVSSGAIVQIINTGLIEDVDTNGYAVGTVLYPNTSGGWTTTKPTSGNYQPAGYVLRGNTNTGVLYVEFSAPRIVERSDNTASTIVLRDASGNFAAGTITAGALTSTGLVTFASLKGTGATTVTNILDEDNMASDSATALATQQSIKAYVDAKVATVDTLAEVLANGNTTGANNIIVSTGQKIQTPTIAAFDNTTAISIANTTGALTLATALADSNLATISTAGKVANSATTATALNTSSAIVARDGSGNFAAGTITANLTGNISGTAPAGTLTGTTLASNVVSSSLTSVGTLSSLTVSGAASIATGVASQLAVFGANNTTDKYITVKNSAGDVYLGSSATSAYLWNVANTPLGFYTNNAERMRIEAGGNLAVDTNTLYVDATNNRVGIGTASPGALVDINAPSGSNTNIAISQNGSIKWYIGNTDTSNAFRFYDNTAAAERMRLDASGNLGLGVTPSAWSSLFKVAQIAAQSAFWGSSTATYISTNNYNDGGDKYIGTGNATRYYQLNGQHVWQTAPSGTAGNAISFTQAMTLDASGNLGVGATSPAMALNANSRAVHAYQNSINGAGFRSESSNCNVELLAGSDLAYLWVTTNDPISFGTGNTERARIDASGNLGVGETSPSSYGKLAVTSAGIGGHFNSTSGAAGINFYESGSGRFSLRTLNGSAGLSFYDSFNSTERARIDSSGNLSLATNGTSFQWTNSGNNVAINATSGVLSFYTGTSAYTERARITSGGYFKASDAGTYAGSTGNYHEFRTSASTRSPTIQNTHATQPFGILVEYTAASPNGAGNDFVYCSDSTAARAVIRSNGGIANYQANDVNLSDERVKTDIKPAGSYWDKLKAIEIVTFKYKDQSHDDDNIGVIAQQVEAVAPEFIDVDGFGETPEDGVPLKTVYTTDLYHASIKALQEAMARIESLEARLAALEN